ncbi:carboxypeptidase-like regulatory domain-containing protein, partial [Hymenobacter agri]
HNAVVPPVSAGELLKLETASAAAAEASATRMVTVTGRILNEKGAPLVGATVFRKGTHFGASTDANGNYALRVPAAEAASTTLQYGYAGYHDREVAASEVAPAGVSLQPRVEKRKHWLFF